MPSNPPSQDARYRVGIDVGGTFTDFAIVEVPSGRLATHKQLTTPQDPSISVLTGLDALLARAAVDIAELGAIVHGTTLVTNAIIERRGARVGMLVTEGFRDVLDLAKETRYDLYDLRLRFAKPVVARSLRVEVAERMRYDGAILKPLDLDAVRGQVDRSHPGSSSSGSRRRSARSRGSSTENRRSTRRPE